ncbi:MAG: flagellar M-ring protein FliF [Rhodospirillaceae bacterium]|nr:flagellar M-ring protein FliF [Rhodospirillaceae bacterium]
MNSLFETIRNLGVGRLVAMAGVTLAIIGFFLFMWNRLSTGQLAVLFTDLDSRDSNQIVANLQGANVHHKVSKDGSRIMVPADQVNQLRLSLAQQGIPASGSIGYELFDRDQSIGTSSFVQNINRIRALEGELARTIAGFQSVRSARVHLVLPRRELFSRQQVEPSASVILRMRGAVRLDRAQIQAVQHLVANAVPSLKASRISIVDDRGALLARGGDKGDGQGAGETANELKVAFEGRMTRTLEQLLEPSVGMGNVRAEVRADMDFDRIVTQEEKYDPQGQVIRSSQNITESSSSTEAKSDAVSVAQNLPDAPNQEAGQGGSQTGSQRTEESTNFEISKTVTNHVKEIGTVRRLSVAVLINGTTTTEADGKETYKPRSKEELDNIEKLVKSAIGFDAGRNDKIEVVNMRFAPLPQTIDDERTTFFGFTTADIRRIIEVLALAFVGILVMLLFVRPMVLKIFESTQAASRARIGADGEAQLLAGAGMAQIPGPAEGQVDENGMPVQASATEPTTSTLDSGEESVMPITPKKASRIDINLDALEGNLEETSLMKIGEIVDKHPEAAIAVIRNWLTQDKGY